MTRLDTLEGALHSVLGTRIKSLKRDRGELTLTVSAADYLATAQTLRDDPALKFEQLIDLCGVDYSSYKDEPRDGLRYCVVSHLLSVTLNWRVRLKVFAPDDDVPTNYATKQSFLYTPMDIRAFRIRYNTGWGGSGFRAFHVYGDEVP